MAMNVEGKTAIVTGAGSGINLCFAKILLENGCNVIFADLALRPEAEAVVAQYPLTSSGAKAVFQKTDVVDWAQLDEMFEVAIKNFGGADIVCPGAGVYEPPWSNFWLPPGNPPSKDNPKESRYALLDINVTHPIRCTQLAIQHFLSTKKPGPFCIPHISSVAGQCAFFPTPVYVATKHAISGFVRSLARLEDPPEMEGVRLPKIRVNACAPARILTPLWTENPDKMKLVSKEPGWVTPEDVGKLMLEMVRGEEYVGGSIWEIGSTIRKVEQFNDGGPSAGGNGVTASEGHEDDMWKILTGMYKGI